MLRLVLVEVGTKLCSETHQVHRDTTETAYVYSRLTVRTELSGLDIRPGRLEIFKTHKFASTLYLV